MKHGTLLPSLIFQAKMNIYQPWLFFAFSIENRQNEFNNDFTWPILPTVYPVTSADYIYSYACDEISDQQKPLVMSTTGDIENENRLTPSLVQELNLQPSGNSAQSRHPVLVADTTACRTVPETVWTLCDDWSRPFSVASMMPKVAVGFLVAILRDAPQFIDFLAVHWSLVSDVSFEKVRNQSDCCDLGKMCSMHTWDHLQIHGCVDTCVRLRNRNDSFLPTGKCS